MRFLVSNDDGYFSAGLVALVEALKPFGEVFVVAPDRDCSAIGHGLTMDRPLTIRQIADGFFCVNGTPADCVYLALSQLMPKHPDMVFSGINKGANMGGDVIYSGTVAAAMEGFMAGIQSVAISLTERNETYLSSATAVVSKLIPLFLRGQEKAPYLLNINVPSTPIQNIVGQYVTRLGSRSQPEACIHAKSPRGVDIYWAGRVGAPDLEKAGTDFWACSKNLVSITPLKIDCTDEAKLGMFEAWLTH